MSDTRAFPGRGWEPGPGAPFAQGAAGLNGLLQLQYEPLVANREVRGRALGRAASHRAVAVAAGDLARRIEANVLVALDAAGNAVQEVRVADEAVRLSERSVRTEQAKFRLGLAALFDAILAEDSLTNARLRRTNARLRHAAALARLRFETRHPDRGRRREGLGRRRTGDLFRSPGAQAMKAMKNSGVFRKASLDRLAVAGNSSTGCCR